MKDGWEAEATWRGLGPVLHDVTMTRSESGADARTHYHLTIVEALNLAKALVLAADRAMVLDRTRFK